MENTNVAKTEFENAIHIEMKMSDYQLCLDVVVDTSIPCSTGPGFLLTVVLCNIMEKASVPLGDTKLNRNEYRFDMYIKSYNPF